VNTIAVTYVTKENISIQKEVTTGRTIFSIESYLIHDTACQACDDPPKYRRKLVSSLHDSEKEKD